MTGIIVQMKNYILIEELPRRWPPGLSNMATFPQVKSDPDLSLDKLEMNRKIDFPRESMDRSVHCILP
jgi:hypothetical protein